MDRGGAAENSKRLHYKTRQELDAIWAEYALSSEQTDIEIQDSLNQLRRTIKKRSGVKTAVIIGSCVAIVAIAAYIAGYYDGWNACQKSKKEVSDGKSAEEAEVDQEIIKNDDAQDASVSTK